MTVWNSRDRPVRLRTQIMVLAGLIWIMPGRSPAEGPRPAAIATPVLQVVGPGGTEAPLISLVSRARQRILVEAFALADSAVEAALEAAERRGVDVRVMLDPLGINSDATLARLESAGIRTRAPNPAFGVTHMAAVVVDAAAAAILTTPLTGAALAPGSSGYAIVDRDRLDVIQVASMFYDDWLRRPTNPFSHNLILLPDEASRVAALIGAAGLRVELYTSYLSDRAVLTSLQNARARGVVVRLLTPPRSNNDSLFLLAAGARVRFRDVGAGTFVVLDRRTVLLGSMDLSTAALSGHRELGIVITSRLAVKTIDSAFFAGYDRGIVLRPAPLHRSKPEVLTVKGPTISVGPLRVSTSVSPVVRRGGTGFVVISTAPGASVDVTIAYPSGSAPTAGMSGAHGTADRRTGVFAYRWDMAGKVALGVAQVRVRVRGLGTIATDTATFTVVR